MLKIQTETANPRLTVQLEKNDKIVVLGSCFADETGGRLALCGFNILVNPFGTLYNPASIAAAVERMESGRPFTEDDCVEVGAGSGLVCSFSHHTSFARNSKAEFLENANKSLEEAAAFWKSCDKVIVTLGTSMVWKHGKVIVANCLKRPGGEFSHEMLPQEDVDEAVRMICRSGKELILTVSPIRHLGDGAAANSRSKARLLLACEKMISGNCSYFPAYEILLDELRDYRYYSEDLVHPSKLAVDIIFEKFIDAAVPSTLKGSVLERYRLEGKAVKALSHRQLHIN